jgi:hypothetical protein
MTLNIISNVVTDELVEFEQHLVEGRNFRKTPIILEELTENTQQFNK